MIQVDRVAREPVELGYAECRDLLLGERIGRVALCTPAGPRIVPVSYSVVDQSVVFRTTPYGVLGSYAWRTRLAFEVDRLDPELGTGWDVVASGSGSLLSDADELAAVRFLADPQPWAAGSRRLYVRLPWDELTGRRFGPAHALG